MTEIMATSNIFKKLRNRITRNRKSYDVDPPGGGHGGTVLLRRYDRVPSSYGAGYDCEHFNVLCDFPAASHSPSSSWVRGDVTLPRHFKVRNGHHRTQSHVTVVDTDEIDLYNAIGDHHRRSSCSCTCTGPRKPVVVPVPVVTLPPSLSVTPQNCPVPSPIGRRRDAAKDPLPPIVNDDMQKALQKEHERFKREGKFAVTQAEIPRYTGIDDYSTVDNFEVPIRIQTGDVSRDVDRKFSTLGQPSRKPPAAADRRVGTLHPGTKQGKNGQKNTFEAVSATNSEGKQYLLQKPQITKDIDKVDEPELDTSTMGGECATVALKDTICSENSSGMVQPQRDPVLMDVIDGYHNGNEQVEVKVEPTLKKDKERTSFVHPRSPQEPPGEQNINQSDPGKDTMERFGRMSVTCEESHFGGKCGPQNSGYHEYKEAHQVLRATSASKLVDLNDLELSSSIEDLYAYVPKGSVKTPDSEFDESPCPSEQNTDNEDNFPPPPIPSRNYRKESYTMTVCRDGETGEDITEDGKRGDGDIREGGESEPIHMTLEEVWIEACARGIPMEKPQNGTLQRRQATLASPTSSPLPVHSLNKSPREHHKHSDDNGTKKKEKFKLRNIFKKTDLDCHLRSPGTTRSGRTGDGWHDSSSEDINNGSDSFNTSGEASSSEVLESVGHQSVSSSGESVVEEQTSSSGENNIISLIAGFFCLCDNDYLMSGQLGKIL